MRRHERAGLSVLFLASCLFGVLCVRNTTLAACEKSLVKQRFFSEYSIAKAIEELGNRDGNIFVAVIHGVPNRRIREKHAVSDLEIEAISHRGIDIMLKLKREGL